MIDLTVADVDDAVRMRGAAVGGGASAGAESEPGRGQSSWGGARGGAKVSMPGAGTGL